MASPIQTDALIIGAGPAGLFQVFELGLREISSHVVDARPFAGGQCVELYGDKPIYDIPALPACTGRELTERLLEQIRPFATTFHFDQLVSHIARGDDGRFDVRTRAGLHFDCGAIVLAAGVGAFVPRTLKVAGLDAFEGRQLFHHADRVPAEALEGKQVLVSGATEQALAFAARLCDAVARRAPGAPARVTLIHRRDAFDAADDTVAAFRTACSAGALHFVAGQPTGLQVDGDRLTGLTLLDATGATVSLPVDTVVVLQGLSPKLGPLADWGLALERRQVQVETAKFQTSVPGLFAIGDVVHYPGKQRLILSAFHEATLAAAGVAGHLIPGDDGPLEYTTSSPRIHKLLGV
ncbi:NAD(P)/FAD-dependent oxidoreductase [Scleromatobacter humisilvae]|uniref:Ferredoxin--NADP reductase n=1 Tax=Scleromatobacter humisilvae TaxID=2897159 RepID=A0A9X2C0D9_9BURK|nr:NAD(P)/FAD-dependent oxidoreductase [Scleromatobacter humisilvae]MCK9687227.1 NAD(P)/FAD-dependent oxidoreductase [Scleromatobacter humisilvae]